MTKIWQLKLTHFLRLSLISLRLNAYYKYNIYFKLLLFIGIIASIIIRSNLITEEWFKIDNLIFIKIIVVLSMLYSYILIFNIFIKTIQAFKIIPHFISFYKQNIKNIQSIISLYYLQNIFFVLLSSWILYNIINKLNLFIDNSQLYILILGILSSLLFFYSYPLKEMFNINVIKNTPKYPLYIYILFICFFIFYIFILPFILFNVIHSDTFIQLKEKWFNQCVEYTKPNYMNTPTSSPSDSNTSRIKITRTGNIVRIPDNYKESVDIVIHDSGNTVEIVSNSSHTIHTVDIQPQIPVTKQIDTVNMNNQPVASSSQNVLSSNQLYLSNSKAFNTEVLQNTVLEYHLLILFFSYLEFFINISIDYLIKWNIISSIHCIDDHPSNLSSNENNPSISIMSKNKVIIHNGGNLDLLANNTIEIGSNTVNIESLHILKDPGTSDSHTRLALTQQNDSHRENQDLDTILKGTDIKVSDLMKNTILE